MIELSRHQRALILTNLTLILNWILTECFILKSDRNSAWHIQPVHGRIKKVEKENNYGIHPRSAEQTFAFEILNDPEVKLVGLTGKAGTGKTLRALAAALKRTRFTCRYCWHDPSYHCQSKFWATCRGMKSR